MAKKKPTTLNKSEAIRQALTQHPKERPVEIARRLTEQHGVTFRPKEVSTIRAKVGSAKVGAHQPSASKGNGMAPTKAGASSPAATGAARQTARPNAEVDGGPAAASGIAEMVSHLQGYIRRLGKEELHRLIDTL